MPAVKRDRVGFRQTQLERLKAAILSCQANILAALRADLRKPDFEAMRQSSRSSAILTTR